MPSDAPRWPHLVRQITRHGRAVWYVRVGHGRRLRLKGAPGDTEFRAAYLAALRGAPAGQEHARLGTLRWLVGLHMESSYWKSALSPATRRQRENIMKGVLAGAADIDVSRITTGDIIAGRERRKATPSQANNYLNTMRSLFAWAVKHGHMRRNPAEGVDGVQRPKSDGFAAWTEDDARQFEARWPAGTRERLALDVLLYTGLRRGDAARLGPAHVRDGRLTIQTEKAGVVVTAPIHPSLAWAWFMRPPAGAAFIARLDGQPMVKEAFGNWFGEACRAAGVEKSAHGIRKLAATRLADAGATEAELDAIMGWTPGSGMSRIYTRNRDAARLSDRAMSKLLGGH